MNASSFGMRIRVSGPMISNTLPPEQKLSPALVSTTARQGGLEVATTLGADAALDQLGAGEQPKPEADCSFSALASVVS